MENPGLRLPLSAVGSQFTPIASPSPLKSMKLDTILVWDTQARTDRSMEMQPALWEAVKDASMLPNCIGLVGSLVVTTRSILMFQQQ